jgi:hypothetical protein
VRLLPHLGRSKGYEGFGIDHYLPKSRFPDLLVAWSNLFYAWKIWSG